MEVGGVIMARTVAIGKQNFETLIENNYFYVDKSVISKRKALINIKSK